MARERDLVGKDVVVANGAVMGHVDADHKKVPRTDARCFSFAIRPVKRAELTDLIVIANFQITLFTFELYVLGLAANDRMLENPVSRADSRRSLDDGIRPDLAIWADFHVFFDYGCGMDSHFLMEFLAQRRKGAKRYRVSKRLSLRPCVLCARNICSTEDNGVLWILQILFMMHG
jgi:hypothetical protein